MYKPYIHTEIKKEINYFIEFTIPWTFYTRNYLGKIIFKQIGENLEENTQWQFYSSNFGEEGHNPRFVFEHGDVFSSKELQERFKEHWYGKRCWKETTKVINKEYSYKEGD